jgi:hypothetical protein
MLYHAIAFSEDRATLYVLSHQNASMHKDQSTPRDVAPGERPKFEQYFVFFSLEVARRRPSKTATHWEKLAV